MAMSDPIRPTPSPRDAVPASIGKQPYVPPKLTAHGPVPVVTARVDDLISARADNV